MRMLRPAWPPGPMRSKTSVLSPSLVNDLRGQYSREGRPRTANELIPNITMSVIGQLGTRNFLPTTLADYRLQFADGLTWQRGRHTLKFGTDYSYLSFGQTFGFNQFGLFNMSGSNVRTLLQLMSANGGASGNRFDDPSVFYIRQIGNLQLAANAHHMVLRFQESGASMTGQRAAKPEKAQLTASSKM